MPSDPPRAGHEARPDGDAPAHEYSANYTYRGSTYHCRISSMHFVSSPCTPILLCLTPSSHNDPAGNRHKTKGLDTTATFTQSRLYKQGSSDKYKPAKTAKVKEVWGFFSRSGWQQYGKCYRLVLSRRDSLEVCIGSYPYGAEKTKGLSIEIVQIRSLGPATISLTITNTRSSLLMTLIKPCDAILVLPKGHIITTHMTFSISYWTRQFSERAIIFVVQQDEILSYFSTKCED
ncbi:hypothetical protein CBL_06991 [Carabus blaptoides fortunei]